MHSPNPVEVMRLAREHEKVFLRGFTIWLAENMHVFFLFSRLADTLWERGRRHYSARTIGEKMRFDHDISESNSKFKLGNNSIPDLGRLYALLNPKRVTLFSYRRGGTFPDYVEGCLEDGTL